MSIVAELPPAPTVLPLECTGLGVTRGGRALLDGIDFRLENRDITVLMGPNGAGKSLFLRVLANLVKPDRGQVRWAGRAPDRARALGIGFVFQKPVMFRRSVLGNLDYVLRATGAPKPDRKAMALSLLRDARLEHLAHAPARVLSGGEQQRLAVVRALAGKPEVLMLDEPTASLDPSAVEAIEGLAMRAAERGAKVLFVTHDVAQGRRIAGDVAFMHHGRIVEHTDAGTFFSRPASEPARAYLGGRILV